MKKFKILLLVSLLLVTANSCKKDYPKDIPDWLKDKIKALNKDSKGKGCEKEECRHVYEYTDGTNTIYLYQAGYIASSYVVYDYSGNEVCVYSFVDSTSCQNFPIQDYYFSRNIWTEK